ncbi:MAG: hypothetical protein ABI162_17730, partial [Luteolibacter sp.]
MSIKNQHFTFRNHFPLRRFFAAFWLFLGWFAQIIPLPAFTADAVWKFETLQNASSEWWQTLTVETVPGVVYHLQKSTTLEPDSWTTISSTYGTGGSWVCPVFPGSAPAEATPGGTPSLPAATADPTKVVFFVLEETTTGGTLISWSSLDDGTMRDRCGKLSSGQGPEFAQAGHGFAPGDPLIESHAHPPDESLGSL